MQKANQRGKREFTATVYILNERKQTLLIYHKKLNKWLPPGGHIEPNELPSETAVREAFEETGLNVQIISDEKIEIDCWNAKSFPRPYLCLLEEIPAHGNSPPHQHMDLIYVASVTDGIETFNDRETGGLRWFSMEEIHSLETDVEIFGETKQVLQKIFSESLVENQNVFSAK